MKNDVRDASDLADLLRMGRLPEEWIAPPAVRELREAVRHRANIAKVAAARKLLTLVYYGLRDGHIRCLARPA